MHSKRILFVMLFSTMIFSTTLAMGQMSANPPHVAQKIREMGNQLTPDVIRITGELYSPLLAEAPKGGVKVTKDEKYGADERNRLDIYQPEKKPQVPTPILVFVHGGRFCSR